MSISADDVPARSRLYFANPSGCALSEDSRGRSSHSRYESLTHTRRKGKLASPTRGAVCFVLETDWARLKLESVETFHTENTQRGAVMQMKPDRRLNGRRISAVMPRRHGAARRILNHSNRMWSMLISPASTRFTICSRNGSLISNP
jgi:hypothetical protein